MDGSQSITSVVEDFFQEDKLKYQEVREGVYRSGFEGREGSYRAFFIAENQTQVLRILIVIESNFAAQYRLLVAEFLNRANCGLKIGNFEIDLDDGSVQFRIAADFEDGILNTRILRRMLCTAIGTMDRYYPGIMETVWGRKSTKEAIRSIEHSLMEDVEESE